jgi:hypothetical protein
MYRMRDVRRAVYRLRTLNLLTVWGLGRPGHSAGSLVLAVPARRRPRRREGSNPQTARSVVMHHPSPPVLLTPSCPHCSWSRAMLVICVGHPFGLEGSGRTRIPSGAAVAGPGRVLGWALPPPVSGLNDVVLLDRHPGQLLSPARALVAAAQVLLGRLQQLLARPRATPRGFQPCAWSSLLFSVCRAQAAAQVFPYSSWRRSQELCSPSSWRPIGVRSSRP